MTDTVNIAAHLPAMAARQPETLAVAFPLDARPVAQRAYLQWSYRQLDEESDRIARGLAAIGITRGMRTVLMVPPSPEFFALVFALFKLGTVLVAVDPGMGVKNLKTCLDEAQPQAFIGIRKAHIARRLLGWAKKTNRINVLVGRKLWPFGGAVSLDEVRRRGSQTTEPLLAATQRDEMAAILFTSGSTGVPKGAVYTHGNFDAQVRALVDLFQIQPGEIDLCTFPLFALYAPAMGMSAIVPRMDFTRPGSVDPAEVFGPIQRFNVTNLFGSPALLKRIAPSLGSSHVKCPGLKRVISAGAPVPARVIEQIKSLLAPGVQVFTPYGATESLPVACIGSDEILGETAALTDQGKGICVGRPVLGLDARIIRISDAPIERWSDDQLLPPGEIGEIVVRGPQVTRSYFNRDVSTNLAKIHCDDGSYFHRMGDVGYFDERGRLWYCGRKSERVISPAGTLYSVPCEAIFNTCAFVERTALVGVRLAGETLPAIVVESPMTPPRPTVPPPHPDQIKEQLLALAQPVAHTRGIHHILFYPRPFPTDIRHNSKINRPLLAKWAAKQLGGEQA